MKPGTTPADLHRIPDATHEIGHMTSGTLDGTLDFESELSHLLGITAAAALAR
jgi:hypothetical protein